MASTIAVPAHHAQGAGAFTCVACGHTQQAPRPVLRASAQERPFDLVRCPDCTLVQQYPRYTTGQFRRLHGEDSYLLDESDEQRWARAVQQYVIHLLPLENRPGRRLLDVGCGLGHLAALARVRGWRVTGIDGSAEAVSQASVRFGLDVRAGSLSRHRDTLGPVDVVFVGHCLERAEAPAALLGDVHRAMAAGGVVCIDTPNWASQGRGWGCGRGVGLNRSHVNLFDAESVGRLLEACGFVDIRAAAYTEDRDEGGAAGPRWLNFLPQFIARRIGRWLSRFSPRSEWSQLRSSPPVNLHQAREWVIEYAGRGDFAHPASPSAGDHLIVQARRK